MEGQNKEMGGRRLSTDYPKFDFTAKIISHFLSYWTVVEEYSEKDML